MISNPARSTIASGAFVAAVIAFSLAAPSVSAQSDGVSVTIEAGAPYLFPFQSVEIQLTVENQGEKASPAIERKTLFSDAKGRQSFLCASPAPPGQERQGKFAEMVGDPMAGKITSLLPGEKLVMKGWMKIPRSLMTDNGVIHVQWIGRSGPLKDLRSNEIQITIRKSKQPVLTLDTSVGRVSLELWPDKAPNHVANLIELVEKGFYDGLIFHRVQANFMVQVGCPEGTGFGGPGYSIQAELSDVPFSKGVLGMARGPSPDSAGSQFFICVADSQHLNKEYTAFGKVLHGQEIADLISRRPCLPGSERPREDVVLKKARVEYPKSYEKPGVTKLENKD